MSVRQSSAPEETEAIAAELAEQLRPGDVVLVTGELGAGKTTFVRGACRALGVTEPVQSPTFTIGRRYRGDLPVSHLDLYRVERPEAEEPGFLDDYLTPDAVAFVEWPERGLALERAAAHVAIAHSEGDRRTIEIERYGAE